MGTTRSMKPAIPTTHPHTQTKSTAKGGGGGGGRWRGSWQGPLAPLAQVHVAHAHTRRVTHTPGTPGCNTQPSGTWSRPCARHRCGSSRSASSSQQPLVHGTGRGIGSERGHGRHGDVTMVENGQGCGCHASLEAQPLLTHLQRRQVRALQARPPHQSCQIDCHEITAQPHEAGIRDPARQQWPPKGVSEAGRWQGVDGNNPCWQRTNRAARGARQGASHKNNVPVQATRVCEQQTRHTCSQCHGECRGRPLGVRRVF